MSTENTQQYGEQLHHFHLVFAEVIFTTSHKQNDISGRRVQVFTKGSDLQFSAHRLQYIQNAAALQARQESGDPPIFDVVTVNLLNFHYCGQFTDIDFWSGITPGDEPEKPKLSVVPTTN